MDYKVLNVHIDSHTIELDRHTEQKKDMIVLICQIGKIAHPKISL